MSTGTAFSTLYPFFVKYFKSLANVSGLHDTYTTFLGASFTTELIKFSSLPALGGSINTTSIPADLSSSILAEVFNINCPASSAKNLILTAVLMVLVFLTGSRTVFIFLGLTVIAFFFTLKNKKLKRNLLIIFGGMVLVSVAVVFITDSVQTVGRFLTISLESSTFLGRILYYLDALPVILKHPFGLGYYGYYFSQGTFQTGVYSVAFVHNSALQFLLDVGWIPSLLIFFVIGASFFSKKSDLRQNPWQNGLISASRVCFLHTGRNIVKAFE